MTTDAATPTPPAAPTPWIACGSGDPGLDAPRRLLFVHAHPDDEASKGAATAARYVDEGARVTLVTCTGGEAGEVLNAALAELDPSTLPEVRARELEAACKVLGFAAAWQLGHRDSGWWEDLDRVPDGTFWRVEDDVAAAPLAAILRRERPQVVVTYPEDGGYPHPDHIKVHAVTMRAVALAADPDAELPALDDVTRAEGPWQVDRVFSSTVWTLAKMEAMDAEHEARGLERVHTEWIERRRERGGEPPTSDAVVAVGEWLDRRDDALRAHATQVDPAGTWFAHSREVERDVAPWEEFHLVSGELPRRPVEDLFEGL